MGPAHPPETREGSGLSAGVGGGEVIGPLVLVLDGDAVRHLARALAGYRRDCRRDRVTFPVEFAPVIDVLASSGVQRPSFDAAAVNGETRLVPLLLEPEGAARQLAVSERTLRRLVKDGEAQAVKIGNSTRFAPQDLERFVDEKRGSS
jgi:excisionase family DNA binding protein